MLLFPFFENIEDRRFLIIGGGRIEKQKLSVLLRFTDRITLVAEDAGKVIERLTEENRSFSFIFMDAAKAQYPVWLPGILRLMRPGSVLVSDNILQDGSIVESRYQVNRRDRTIHTRMREYLYMQVRVKQRPWAMS